jgi:uncharacterized protein
VPFTPSRYNFAVSGADRIVVLFNASSGSVVRLDGTHAYALAEALLNPSATFSGDELAPDLSRELRRGGFLIREGFDELQTIRERYWRARGETPLVLTITTTMDCNLGCYYCYEERSGDALKYLDVAAIVDVARNRVAESGRHSLHVDWYGGEPLLNMDFLEAASKELQAYCASNGVSYVASIISNGTRWPSDIEGFVARNRIRQVQISFDGLRANHDKRRRYRKKRSSANRVGKTEQILAS